MIIIYDFDGTLTPFVIPQYEILKRYGYDDTKLFERVSTLMKKKNIGLYEAMYETYEEILKENNQEMNYSNVVLGSKNVEFNPGVLSYFDEMGEVNTGVKHFIVTSGLEDYVRNTSISSFVNGIYGVTYHRDNDKFTSLDRLITDEDKPKIIQSIVSDNSPRKVVYVGDGPTDKYAFQFVHSIGGVCIYVGSTKKDFHIFESLKSEGIVDEYFIRDYSDGNELRKYLKNLVYNEMDSKLDK